jgi:hypothetical protein
MSPACMPIMQAIDVVFAVYFGTSYQPNGSRPDADKCLRHRHSFATERCKSRTNVEVSPTVHLVF